MRRHLSLFVSLAGLCAALLAAGCGGSSAVTGPDEAPPPARGSAILQGTILGAGLGGSSSSAPVRAFAGATGWTVSIVGTSVTGEVDEDGRFLLSGAPAGSLKLRIEGPGVSAQIDVTGLLDGQVTSIEVKITGGQAQLTTSPSCAPTAPTSFAGVLERMTGTDLVVSGRTVDASRNLIVWRGDRKVTLSELQIGEKVKVWGTLRGDGVVVSEEIAALTTGPGPDSETYVIFSGRVDSVGASSLDFHANPNPGAAKYPTLFVKQTIVIVNAETKVKRTDGSQMSASEIKVGQSVTVEGWKRTDGAVRATRITVDGAAEGGGGDTWVTFKGTVESVASTTLGALDEVHGNPTVSYPTLWVAGRKVKTDGGTRFKWSDGTALDPAQIRAGDQAYVEGWSKPEGYVLAAKVQVDKR